MAAKHSALTVVLVTALAIAGCGVELFPDGRNAGAPGAVSEPDPVAGHDADLGGVPPIVGSTNDTPVPPPATPVDPVAPVPDAPELNAGWIGGACATATDCTAPGYTARAVCETDGFTGGMCTQSCIAAASGAWVCPDTDTGADTLATTTRCIDANGGPRCASECDFGLSETGCRPGYACVLRQRYEDPSRIFQICVPSDLGRWPGEPAPPVDIGSPCDGPQDCAHLSCLSYAGGYCSKSMCDHTSCPDGSACFTLVGSNTTQCMKQCASDSECRSDEGYYCDSAHSTCWPADGGRWNSTVGATDCSSAWGDSGHGLSRCDATPDNYIVIHKSARNVALCKRGTVVDNFAVGLGYEPVGDKEVEGDGKTPEGVFYVARTVPYSSFYKAFLVSYPDKSDATRGYAAGLLSASEKHSIDTAQDGCSEPPQYTGLGGMVEVHGGGGGHDWTLGCMAADNSAIDAIWAVLKARDTIVILP